MDMEIQTKQTPEDVARALAEQMVEWSREGHLRHIALSGGSTPRLLFDILAAEYRHKLPWEQLVFYWGDERCVPPDHDQSNYGMTRERLLDPLGIDGSRVHRIRGEAEPEREARRYAGILQEQLPQPSGIPRFDLVLLGLGTDGHTASIFPHEAALWDAEAFCEIATHPESGQKRITLTGQVINQAARVVFLVTGQSKAKRVREILEDSAAAASYPAARVAPSDGKLIWMLDQAAAGQR